MRRLIPFLVAVVVLAGCSSIECPINNLVCLKYKLGDEASEIPGTLSISIIRSDGSDSTILNRLSGKSEWTLPVSYTQAADVLVFSLTDYQSIQHTDTVSISKTNIPHFESVECSPTYFHQLTDVSWTRHALDSVIITKSTVNYDTTGGHIKVYFKSDI